MSNFPVVTPRIETARLSLRQLEARDFDAFAAHFMDAAAIAPLTPVPNRGAAWQKLGTYVGMWVLTGAGWWALELRDTRELVGVVGAFFRESALDRGAPRVDAAMELGWTVLPAHRGKGLATEAGRAALAHGFHSHPVTRATALVDPINVASVRVCEALGMTLEGEEEIHDARFSKFAITRDRWREGGKPRAG